MLRHTAKPFFNLIFLNIHNVSHVPGFASNDQILTFILNRHIILHKVLSSWGLMTVLLFLVRFLQAWWYTENQQAYS